jgi:hypothetical protein
MSNLRFPLAATAVSVTMLFFASEIRAQVNTSTIAGVVTDPTGAFVGNAKVVATLLTTGQQRATRTNDAGEYVFPQLAPGVYRLNVTATGFQTAIVDDLTLNIAERSTVNVSLNLGLVSEQVSVTAAAPLLEQETASLGQVIARKAINDLPLNGRNYITLGSLSPGSDPAASHRYRIGEFYRLHHAKVGPQPAGWRPARKLQQLSIRRRGDAQSAHRRQLHHAFAGCRAGVQDAA